MEKSPQTVKLAVVVVFNQFTDQPMSSLQKDITTLQDSLSDYRYEITVTIDPEVPDYRTLLNSSIKKYQSLNVFGHPNDIVLLVYVIGFGDVTSGLISIPNGKFQQFNDQMNQIHNQILQKFGGVTLLIVEDERLLKHETSYLQNNWSFDSASNMRKQILKLTSFNTSQDQSQSSNSLLLFLSYLKETKCRKIQQICRQEKYESLLKDFLLDTDRLSLFGKFMNKIIKVKKNIDDSLLYCTKKMKESCQNQFCSLENTQSLEMDSKDLILLETVYGKENKIFILTDYHSYMIFEQDECLLKDKWVDSSFFSMHHGLEIKLMKKYNSYFGASKIQYLMDSQILIQQLDNKQLVQVQDNNQYKVLKFVNEYNQSLYHITAFAVYRKDMFFVAQRNKIYQYDFKVNVINKPYKMIKLDRIRSFWNRFQDKHDIFAYKENVVVMGFIGTVIHIRFFQYKESDYVKVGSLPISLKGHSQFKCVQQSANILCIRAEDHIVGQIEFDQRRLSQRKIPLDTVIAYVSRNWGLRVYENILELFSLVKRKRSLEIYQSAWEGLQFIQFFDFDFDNEEGRLQIMGLLEGKFQILTFGIERELLQLINEEGK